MKKIKLLFSVFFVMFFALIMISCGSRPHVHSLIEYSKKEATCTDDGYEAYVKCTTCDYTTYKVIKAKGHDFDTNYEFDESKHYNKCKNCDTTSNEENHIFNWVVDTEPTEEETGLKHEECDICHYKRNENTTIVKLNHIHEMEHVIKVDKTCTNDGNIEYYHCNKCEKNYLDEEGTNEVIDIIIKASHEYGSIINEIASTCTKEGLKEHYECSVCHKYFDVEKNEINDLTIEKKSHEIIHHAKKEATCEDDGYEAYDTCKNCDYTTYKVIKAKGHDFDTSWSYDKANHYYKCNSCDTKKNEGNHNFIWIVDKEATEDETGLKHEECSVCHYKRNENTMIDKLAHTHNMEHILKVDKTCTSDGNIEYYHCSKCNKNYLDVNGNNEVEDVIIKALGHNYTGILVSENGITKVTYQCNNCIDNYVEEYKVIDSNDYNINYDDCAYPTIEIIKHNYETSIDLNNLIVVPSYCTWILSKDENGLNIISTKNMELELGDNYAYIIVSSNDGKYSTTYYLDIYKLSMYTYSFANDETILKTETVEENTIIDEPDFNLSNGELFLTWVDSNTQEEAYFPYVLKSDVTFTAHWGEKKYRIHFDTNGGDHLADLLVECGNTITLPTPNNENYVFVGWEYNDRLYKEIEVTEDIALKAIWTKDFQVELLADGTIKIIKYTGNASTNIEFPKYTTIIGDFAFVYCNSIISVEIPYGVREIGLGAFGYCDNLTNIKMPNSLTIIGDMSFPSCSNLLDFDIPNSVTSIGTYAFASCYKLTKIEIPSSVTNIGLYAFAGCSSLIDIKVDSNNKVYDSRNNCNAIIETSSDKLVVGCAKTIILNNIKIIGTHAFLYCSGLTSIEIPSSVTSIEEKAFWGCIDLKNIKIDSNNKIYDSRNNCNAIIETATNTLLFGCMNTIIPNDVTSIAEDAFRDCGNLTNIVIPNSIISIGKWAFSSCVSLESIEIPSSVKIISEYAFTRCSSLKSIIINSNNKVYDSRNNCNAIIETKSNTLIFGCMNTIIPNSVTSIRSNAFEGCSGLISINIPSSVTSIGSCVFNHCTNLTKITVDSSNKFYDSRNNCNAIIETSRDRLVAGCMNTIIPINIKIIGGQAFYGCVNLKSLEIPSSVTTIENNVFNYCTSLKSIIIPITVTKINWDIFSECSDDLIVYCEASSQPSGWDYGWNSSNARVVWGKSDVKKYKVSFNTNGGNYIDDLSVGLGALVKLPIPSNGDLVFVGWEYNGILYKEIEVTEDITLTAVWTTDFEVELLDDGTFKIVKYLGNASYVEIPRYASIIGDGAFAFCDNLTSIDIPNGILSIGMNAFESCFNLESVTIPNSVMSIRERAFSGCSSLVNIEIPSSVTVIENFAFASCSNLAMITVDSNNKLYDSRNNCNAIIKTATNTLLFGCMNTIIPNDVISIAEYAFLGSSLLTSIEIPSSVTNINFEAFNDCTSLERIVVDSNNKIYDSRNNCNAIIETATNTLIFGCMNTIIPNDIKIIGAGAFYNCINLTNIEIPNSVISIEEFAFFNCSNLISIEISKSVISIGEYAFSECSSLTIYCEATAKPDDWSYDWNSSECVVVWNYKKES